MRDGCATECRCGPDPLLCGVQDLFACGVARSGAYNRTLTPFGFQAEERTIWQAPDIYSAMSPFMQARIAGLLFSRGSIPAYVLLAACIEAKSDGSEAHCDSLLSSHALRKAPSKEFSV